MSRYCEANSLCPRIAAFVNARGCRIRIAASNRIKNADRIAGEEGANILGSFAVKSAIIFVCDVAEMRGEDYIFEASQSVIRGQRFLVVDIERGACDFTGFKRGDERALLHDGAARSIDEVGGRFHRGQFIRPDKSARTLAQYGVNRQEIATTEEFLLLDALHAQRIRVLDRQVFAP